MKQATSMNNQPMMSNHHLLFFSSAADSIILDQVYHADVLPNPIGGKNAKLVGCQWYADKIDEWFEAL